MEMRDVGGIGGENGLQDDLISDLVMRMVKHSEQLPPHTHKHTYPKT